MNDPLQCQRLGHKERGIIVKIYTLETLADLQKTPFLVLFLKVVSRVNWSNPILSKLSILIFWTYKNSIHLKSIPMLNLEYNMISFEKVTRIIIREYVVLKIFEKYVPFYQMNVIPLVNEPYVNGVTMRQQNLSWISCHSNES